MELMFISLLFLAAFAVTLAAGWMLAVLIMLIHAFLTGGSMAAVIQRWIVEEF